MIASCFDEGPSSWWCTSAHRTHTILVEFKVRVPTNSVRKLFWTLSSLYVTTMSEFDNEALAMLTRDSSYSQVSALFKTIQSYFNYLYDILYTVCSKPYATWAMSHSLISDKRVKDWSHSRLNSSSLAPSNLFIGEKALIYVHPKQFNVYYNFW